jgi:hypothetical protein
MNDREPSETAETTGISPLQSFESHGIPVEASMAATRLGRPTAGQNPIDGVVRNGVVVPDDPAALPEGSRVRIVLVESASAKTFGERFGRFKGAADGLPEDLSAQHDHYRLGSPKR